MKLTLNLILVLIAFTFMGCEKKTPFSDFKYANKGAVLNCENINTPLFNEALFSFENDIVSFYNKNGPENIGLAYSQFMRNAINGRAKYIEIVSPHTVKIFEALKNENNLWDAENTKSYLNYKSDYITCILANIKDAKLKTTFNALVSTNSMSPELFGTPISRNYRVLTTDKYLAAYVALDLYYAKLFKIDLSQVKDKPVVEEKVDFNKRPVRTTPTN